MVLPYLPSVTRIITKVLELIIHMTYIVVEGAWIMLLNDKWVVETQTYIKNTDNGTTTYAFWNI
jgi:hypothetical protein